MRSFLKSLAIAFIFIAGSAFSQSGTMSTTALVFPDSSCIGMTDSVFITVKNVDTAAYSGSISMMFATNHTNFSPVQFCFIQQITLQPNDSVSSWCNIIFDSTNFTGGSNIVVVWSSGTAKAPADSIHDSVYICMDAAVHERANDIKFSINPTVTSSYVDIEFPGHETTTPQICVLDIFGRTVLREPVALKDNKGRIEVSQLPAGLYFFEVSDGARKSARKFVKVD